MKRMTKTRLAYLLAPALIAAAVWVGVVIALYRKGYLEISSIDSDRIFSRCLCLESNRKPLELRCNWIYRWRRDPVMQGSDDKEVMYARL
jgi:hypothetical protein